MQVSAKFRRAANGLVAWCPACEELHIHPDTWTFDGNLDKPTFIPSFRHTGQHWNAALGKSIETVCHYMLTAGVLEFCADCTHALAGKHVPLPDLPEHAQDPPV